MNTQWKIILWIIALSVATTSGCGTESTDGVALNEGGDSDWCVEHNIAESACAFCNPGLIEELGWCAGHNVAEAMCWICRPAMIAAYQSVNDWCAGHGLPESQCLDCNPELGLAADAPMESALVSATDEPRYRRAPSVSCNTNLLKVNFERESVAQEAGFEYATVKVQSLSQTLECSAVLEYDANHFAKLSPQMGGLISSVEKDLGQKVELGETLAVIVSPTFGAAKAVYLQSLALEELWSKNHAREMELLSRGVATERDLLEAETSMVESTIARSSAQQKLMGLGLTPAQIDEVARTQDTTSEYRVTAPFAGVVVERRATVGELSDPSEPLFALADVSRMWARLDIFESDMMAVQDGQSVVLHLEGLPGEATAGIITWVSSEIDPRTRTLQARAELENPDGKLRANLFGKAVVTVSDARPTVIVPRSAVQWEGCCNVVFVKDSSTAFHPAKVHLGPKSGSMVEVRRGLNGGESIVTQGSFLLKTEILKGSIGAGCCEAHPGS